MLVTQPQSIAAVPREARLPQRAAVASAPMRVSFAGGGTDLPPFVPGIGGRVVGSALDLRIQARVEPFQKGWVRLEVGTSGAADEGEVRERVHTRRRGEARKTDADFRLLEAVLAHAGVEDGVRLRVASQVGAGAGLGG